MVNDVKFQLEPHAGEGPRAFPTGMFMVNGLCGEM